MKALAWKLVALGLPWCGALAGQGPEPAPAEEQGHETAQVSWPGKGRELVEGEVAPELGGAGSGAEWSSLPPDRRQRTLEWVRRRAQRDARELRHAWDSHRKGWALLGILRMDGQVRALLLPAGPEGAAQVSQRRVVGGRVLVATPEGWLRGDSHPPVRLAAADPQGVVLELESGESWRVDF